MSVRFFSLNTVLELLLPYRSLASLDESVEILSHLAGRKVEKIEVQNLALRHIGEVVRQKPQLKAVFSPNCEQRYSEIKGTAENAKLAGEQWSDWLVNESGLGLSATIPIAQKPLEQLETS